MIVDTFLRVLIIYYADTNTNNRIYFKRNFMFQIERRQLDRFIIPEAKTLYTFFYVLNILLTAQYLADACKFNIYQ